MGGEEASKRLSVSRQGQVESESSTKDYDWGGIHCECFITRFLSRSVSTGVKFVSMSGIERRSRWHIGRHKTQQAQEGLFHCSDLQRVEVSLKTGHPRECNGRGIKCRVERMVGGRERGENDGV